MIHDLFTSPFAIFYITALFFVASILLVIQFGIAEAVTIAGICFFILAFYSIGGIAAVFIGFGFSALLLGVLINR